MSLFLAPVVANTAVSWLKSLVASNDDAEKIEDSRIDTPASAVPATPVDKTLLCWELGPALPRRVKNTYFRELPTDTLNSYLLIICGTKIECENERLIDFTPTEDGYSSADENWTPSATRLVAAYDHAETVGWASCTGGCGGNCVCVLEKVRQCALYFLSDGDDTDTADDE